MDSAERPKKLFPQKAATPRPRAMERANFGTRTTTPVFKASGTARKLILAPIKIKSRPTMVEEPLTTAVVKLPTASTCGQKEFRSRPTSSGQSMISTGIRGTLNPFLSCFAAEVTSLSCLLVESAIRYIPPLAPCLRTVKRCIQAKRFSYSNSSKIEIFELSR